MISSFASLVSVFIFSFKRFIFSANTGCYVDSVIVDGSLVDSLVGYTFYNVTANHTIRAVFARNTYTITVTQGTNGTITPVTSVVDYGTDKQFTFTANAGYHLDSVIVDDVKVDSTTSYTFYNITSAHSIAAY